MQSTEKKSSISFHNLLNYPFHTFIHTQTRSHTLLGACTTATDDDEDDDNHRHYLRFKSTHVNCKRTVYLVARPGR